MPPLAFSGFIMEQLKKDVNKCLNKSNTLLLFFM